jgi:polyhydroxybutyrate depolymerase
MQMSWPLLLTLGAGLWTACESAEPGPDHSPVREAGSPASVHVDPVSDAGAASAADAGGGDLRDASMGSAETGLPGAMQDASPSDASAAEPARADASVASDAADADAATTVCMRTGNLKPGDNRRTLMYGGRSRSSSVHVPQSLKAGAYVPLVLDFHGNGSGSAQEASGSGWKEKAEEQGFLVVYADGVGGSWNVGNCCGQALSGNVDDVGFARAMIAHVSEAACVDSKRVYATGISNGAGLAHRLACEAADVIAAIAATSADLVTDPCKPARPISELSIRGLNDTLVAYAGGNTGSTGWYSPGAKGTLALWKDIDRCSGAMKTSRQYCETYDTCAAGVEVTLCSLPNTGHILYDNRLGFRVPDVAWEMFQRQRLP